MNAATVKGTPLLVLAGSVLLCAALASVPNSRAQTILFNEGIEFPDETQQTRAAGSFGDNNTRVGTDALLINTTGQQNTAIGAQTLPVNLTGFNNTAIGYNVLRSNTSNANTASGAFALEGNTSGAENSAGGVSALRNNSNGSNNTAYGNFALFQNTGGNNNIALGYEAGYDVDGDNNISIGNRGVASESGAIRIGDSIQSSAFIAGIRGKTTGIADAISVVIDSNGQLGTVSSSRRFKQDIAVMGSASEPLLDLQPVTFRYKNQVNNAEQPMQYGLIAEDVAETFPELVVFDSEGEPQTVKYRLLSVLLLNELQEQYRVNHEQQATLNELQRQSEDVEMLKAQVADLRELKHLLVASQAE